MAYDPNNMVAEAMKSKEAAMIMIGARIITDRTGNETAEGARIRFASENSVLGDLVGNLSQGLNQAIQWVCEFMGAPVDDIKYKINDEFYDKSVDPQLIMSMVTLLDRSIIAEQDIFDRLKSAGVIDPERTLDAVQDERGVANPMIGSGNG